MLTHPFKNALKDTHPYKKKSNKTGKRKQPWSLQVYAIRWRGYIQVVLLASCVHTCAEFNITFIRTVARSVQTGKQLHVYEHWWSRPPGNFLHVLLRKGLSLVNLTSFFTSWIFSGNSAEDR